MKHVNRLLQYLFAPLLATAIFIGCHNNDTAEDTTETTSTTDTATTVLPPDTATTTMDNARQLADSLRDKPDRTVMKDTIGAAKPNAAKKGMKGKVSIPSLPAKKSGSMEADKSGVYTNVEVLPTFPGGTRGLQKFFDDNLEYPADASSDGVEGTVSVSFVVDETGKLTSPQVTSEKLGYGLEAEALRVINKMPTWTPGKLKGKNVKTRFTLPVRFVLY